MVALTLLGFLGWLGTLLLAIALVVGFVVLIVHVGGNIDIDPQAHDPVVPLSHAPFDV